MRECCDGLKEAGVEPRLLIADAVVQAVVATLWMFLMANRHVYLALKAEHPICILEHCVPFVLQEHTLTLLWAPRPASLALRAHTTLHSVSFFNQAASHVQLALLATSPVYLDRVPVVLQEHTQTLLWAPQPAFNAQQELTARHLASFPNQTAPRVQQVPSTMSLDQAKGPHA